MNAKTMFDKASPDTQLLVASNLAVAQPILLLREASQSGSFLQPKAKPIELLQKQLDLIATTRDDKADAA